MSRDMPRESDRRFTNIALIRALVESFGRISFDPCYDEECEFRPEKFLNVRLGDDGLRDDWAGRFVLVNPPWSNQKKWVERAIEQWSRGRIGTMVVLVPVKTDTALFQTELPKHADVFLILGRPKFSKPEGKAEPTSASTMLLIFGATRAQLIRLQSRVPGTWCQLHSSPPRRSRK